MIPMLFDTHAHYDDEAFDADRDALLSALPGEGVALVLNPGCDVPSSRTAVALAERYSHVYAAVGVHPENCAGYGPADLEQIRALAPRCTLAIVTNGVARAQRGRFEGSPLAGLVSHLFISEELGAAKPDPAFFAAVLRALGGPDKSRVLMVGDNLATDVRGGLEAGLPTVWYNPRRLPNPTPWVPTWTVERYPQLESLILGGSPPTATP